MRAKIFPESKDGAETLGKADKFTIDPDFTEESTPKKDKLTEDELR